MDRREISAQHVAELSANDAGDYWWYAVRQRHVVDQLRAATAGRPFGYLDFGCGTGGVLQSVMAALAPREALGLDGTQEAVDIGISRGLPARYADFRRPLELPFRPEGVTCLDVLEHLEDPVGALRHLHAASAEGASLVVTVPAMPSLWSRWDEVCGHHRRYTRRALAEHLTQGGWRPLRLRWVFSYCVPPAFVQRRVLRTVQEVELPPVGALANRLLTWAGQLERRLGAPLPFGTSLLATARRDR